MNGGEGHGQGNGLFEEEIPSLSLVHTTFYWCIYSIFPNSSEERSEQRGSKRQKGHPQHVWRVIIFLMTVSSGKMDQIQNRRERERETVGAAKDLFQDMFYVKALDIP